VQAKARRKVLQGYAMILCYGCRQVPNHMDDIRSAYTRVRSSKDPQTANVLMVGFHPVTVGACAVHGSRISNA